MADQSSGQISPLGPDELEFKVLSAPRKLRVGGSGFDYYKTLAESGK
jgi:hypothetical protein